MPTAWQERCGWDTKKKDLKMVRMRGTTAAHLRQACGLLAGFREELNKHLPEVVNRVGGLPRPLSSVVAQQTAPALPSRKQQPPELQLGTERASMALARHCWTGEQENQGSSIPPTAWDCPVFSDRTPVLEGLKLSTPYLAPPQLQHLPSDGVLEPSCSWEK